MMLVPPPATQTREQEVDERRRAEFEREQEGRRAEREAIRVAEERWAREHANDPYANPLSQLPWTGAT